MVVGVGARAGGDILHPHVFCLTLFCRKAIISQASSGSQKPGLRMNERMWPCREKNSSWARRTGNSLNSKLTMWQSQNLQFLPEIHGKQYVMCIPWVILQMLKPPANWSYLVHDHELLAPRLVGPWLMIFALLTSNCCYLAINQSEKYACADDTHCDSPSSPGL